jgi:curved DNA-binding protein CbpA
MSIVRPFEDARAALGVGALADRAAVKAAYRAGVQEHPPDRDPEGFRRVREAYELLSDPGTRAKELILSRRPAVPPPAPAAPIEPAPAGATALALLRAVAARVDSAALLAAEREAAASAAAKAKAPRKTRGRAEKEQHD